MLDLCLNLIYITGVVEKFKIIKENEIMAFNCSEISNQVRKEFFNLMNYFSYESTPSICDIEMKKLYGDTESAPTIEQLQITDFIVEENADSNEIKISICSKYPGLIIGKRGNLITFIQNYISDKIGKTVRFHIFQSNMFYFNEDKNNFKIKTNEQLYY